MSRGFVDGDVLVSALWFPPYLKRTDAIWFHEMNLIVVDRALSKRQQAEAVIRLVQRQLGAAAAVSILDRPLRGR